jgi:hypothetical protein
MACFIVPVAEAVVTTVAAKALKSREAKAGHGPEAEMKVPFSRKLGWLSRLLWGGSALLCFEHVWHGEVVPWFPFLTAAATPESTSVMLQEMASVGGSMAALLTLVWVGMLAVTGRLQKKAQAPRLSAN